MVEALMREVKEVADGRNIEVLERLLLQVLIPSCECKKCRLRYEYVVLKINAHRIHKRIRAIWDEPEVFALQLIRSGVIGEIHEKKGEINATLCVCGGSLWRRLSYPFTWRARW